MAMSSPFLTTTWTQILNNDRKIRPLVERAAELCGVLLRPRSFSLPPRVPRRTRGTRTPAYRRDPPAGYAVVQRYASHPSHCQWPANCLTRHARFSIGRLVQIVAMIPSEDLRALAEGVAWLGNDETRYTRKWLTEDIQRASCGLLISHIKSTKTFAAALKRTSEALDGL